MPGCFALTTAATIINRPIMAGGCTVGARARSKRLLPAWEETPCRFRTVAANTATVIAAGTVSLIVAAL